MLVMMYYLYPKDWLALFSLSNVHNVAQDTMFETLAILH